MNHLLALTLPVLAMLNLVCGAVNVNAKRYAIASFNFGVMIFIMFILVATR
jgi:hypothetical protein